MLLKLQRKVKELEQNKQSLWERLDEKEGTRQEKARVKARTSIMFSFPWNETLLEKYGFFIFLPAAFFSQ